jgi:hypothetical protein
MKHNSENESQRAQDLIKRLPPAKLSVVIALMETILDPVKAAIENAPMDDEEITPETAAALDEAREWLKHNKGIPHEEVLAELGITKEEIDNFKEPK